MTPAARDLLDQLDLALERGAHLLTAGEAAVVAAVRALPGPALDLLANLAGRVERPRRAEDLLDGDGAALDELQRAGFVDGLVRAADVARALTVPELRAACAARGLPARGLKDALVDALLASSSTTGAGPRWWTGRWFRLRHRGLLRRLRQWAALRPWPDPKDAVLERLGVIRWPEYPLTSGTALFPTRGALLRWEAALEARDPEPALAAWSSGQGWAPSGLGLDAVLAERVRAGAEAAERAGDLAAAARLYAGWRGRRAEVAFRAARVQEATGDRPGALRLLREGLADATPSEAAALARAGRRLAKALGTSFPPAPPLPAPVVRSVRLSPAPPDGPRPRWEGGLHLEAAVVERLAALGRRAVHSEGSAWRTVVTALLADVMFLPVPGALPVPRLSAPLDFGGPAFAARRADALAALNARIQGDGAAAVFTAGWERFRGVRVRGLDGSWPDDVLAALVAAVPDPAWAALVAARAAGRSFGGLPDLVVLPGPAVTLPGALPGRLGPHLHAVELKGPTDALRDHQADWLATLSGLGVCAERWEVAPHPASDVARGPSDRIHGAVGSGAGASR